MSQRYVWEKWNRQTNYSYSEDWNIFRASSASSYSYSFKNFDGYYLGYNFNSTNGNVSLSQNIGSDSDEIRNNYMGSTVYWSAKGYTSIVNGEIDRDVDFGTNRYFKQRIMNYQVNYPEQLLTVEVNTSYSKGSTSYGNELGGLVCL